MIKWLKDKLKGKVEEPITKVEYQPADKWEIGGIDFKLGDKVIGRSNECDPLLIGEIIEFWDNDGKWTSCIPYVKESGTDKILGCMGILRHYDEELLKELEPLKPLEQWNYLLPEDHHSRYTEEDMVRKQKSYEKRQKIKEKLDN